MHRCGCHQRDYIQIHLMLLFILYHTPDRMSAAGFKYISCFCLSFLFDVVVKWLQQFKYISCYCLSVIWDKPDKSENDSNTSHVIVYRGTNIREGKRISIQIHLMLLFIKKMCVRDRSGCNSNTSHVIVYRNPMCKR